MGDMREEFDALKAYKAEKKTKRLDHNVEALLTAGDVPAREQSKGVWRVNTPAGAVMYYPATNCWQHRGKVCRGDVAAFIDWYKKQQFARPQ